MLQSNQQSASRILNSCLQQLQKTNRKINQNQNISTSKNKSLDTEQKPFNPLPSVFSVLSPHEESENNKIIQKLRRKANKKKQSKQIFIRKTDLGQNQLIFTKQELQKLKQIDDQQIYGKKVPHNQINTQNQNLNQAQSKYFNKVTLDNPTSEIQNNLRWIDINKLSSNQDKKKNKILNFQKRQKSSLNFHSNHNHSKKSMPTLLPKHSYNKNCGLRQIHMNKAKSCYPLIKKNSVDKGFLNSLNSTDQYGNKTLTQKQKLNKIIDRVNHKLQKELSNQNQYIYMTEERKQAIFQCQILRKIKSELGPKFYNKLQLTYGSNDSSFSPKKDLYKHEHNKQNNESHRVNNIEKISNNRMTLKQKQKNIQNLNNKQKGFYFINTKQKGLQSQAQKMIHKNYNRLKQERKRVIQKIVC